MADHVDVYVQLHNHSTRSSNELNVLIKDWITEFKNDMNKVDYCLKENGEATFTDFSEMMNDDIAAISISFGSNSFKLLESRRLSREFTDAIETLTFDPYIYKLKTNNASQDSSLDEEEANSAFCISLPAAEFQGIWQNLFFDHSIKDQLINFVFMSILFEKRSVNQNIINWNKVVLLYGPPGTGKTSLCKALAQTLSIKLSDCFQCAKLIEINSHSLFSRWFSESGKLIMKLFNEIQEFILDPKNLAFVLIDEVETLVHTRQMLMSGNDPSDAMRVVNALLTEIDRIKNHTNVVILTTSNIIGAIDVAFVDRADIKQYIGFPNERIIYEIYRSCINELMKKNILMPPEELFTYHQISNVTIDAFCSSKRLQTISAKSCSMSGRILRKMSFVALASHSNGKIPVTVQEFLNMLEKSVEKHLEEISLVSTK